MMKPIFLFLSFLFAATSTYAANFRCVQPNGKISYQEMPCEKQAKIDSRTRNEQVSERSRIEAQDVAKKDSALIREIENERRRR
ncbi:MAG: DUF4124 domain-containing protein [Zoogloeaceae bacterium]|jgi:hypothetical protein|nr:DUF4124 domain-containing protein [Zoogloeaceae bacterium]